MTEPVKKADLRAEIARLREELAAERARSETLREHAHCQGFPCAHAIWIWPYIPAAPATPAPVWTSQPYTVTCESGSNASGTPGAALAAALNGLGQVTEISYAN